jgi:hypothetical protein
MNLIRKILSWFTRKNQWDSLNYGKPAKVEDEMSRLNNER